MTMVQLSYRVLNLKPDTYEERKGRITIKQTDSKTLSSSILKLCSIPKIAVSSPDFLGVF